VLDVLGWHLFVTLPAILSLALLLYWIVIVIVLINDGRDPTRTLAWLFVLAAVPGFGLIFYFFFGRNWKKKTMKGEWIKEIRRISEPTLQRIRETYAADSEHARAWSLEHGYSHLTRLIERADGAVPLAAYDVRILPNGAEKFAQLAADLSSARETINIQYFIWERDELTASLTKVLLDRLNAGVEGTHAQRLHRQHPVQEGRDQAAARRRGQDPVRRHRPGQGEYATTARSSRSTVVLGYTGGINVGQEYIDGGSRFATWRDTHVRFTGPAVSGLQKLFASRWHESTGESLFTERSSRWSTTSALGAPHADRFDRSSRPVGACPQSARRGDGRREGASLDTGRRTSCQTTPSSRRSSTRRSRASTSGS